MATSTELRTQHNALVAEMKSLYNSAEADKRELTTEEDEKWGKLKNEKEVLEKQIKQADQREYLETAEAEAKVSQGRKTSPTATATRFTNETLTREVGDEIFRQWTLAGTPGCRPDAELSVRAANHGFNLNDQVISYRALSKGTTTAGGFTVPQSFSNEVEKLLAYYFPIQTAVDVFSTDDGRDFPWPVVQDSGNAASIVTEASGIGSSTDPAFTQITYKSFDYYSPIVKVSTQLLRDSATNVPALLAELFAERFGRALDAAVVSSNAGTSAPEGLLNGLSAGCTLATGNPITVAKLLELESSLNLAYRSLPGTGFMMHDTTWFKIRELAESTGKLLLNPDLGSATKPQLFGYPVFISNSLTAWASDTDNLPIMIFGNFKKYKVRRVGTSSLTRLNELYAANGQVGFCMHEAFDGRWIATGAAKTMMTYNS